jgi:RNA polymerase sigma-70 factor (ECF subfamily)
MDAPAPPLTRLLLDRARAGERDAYERLFALAADRLLLFIRLRLGAGLREKVDSLDVLQETFLEAHRALPGFEAGEDGAFARWLCRIAENRLRGLADHHGAKKRTLPTDERPVSDVLAAHAGPSTLASRKETRDRLERALGELAPDEQQALLLRYFEDRGLEEIAERLGRSPTAVRRLLGRGLAALGGRLR